MLSSSSPSPPPHENEHHQPPAVAAGTAVAPEPPIKDMEPPPASTEGTESSASTTPTTTSTQTTTPMIKKNNPERVLAIRLERMRKERAERMRKEREAATAVADKATERDCSDSTDRKTTPTATTSDIPLSDSGHRRKRSIVHRKSLRLVRGFSGRLKKKFSFATIAKYFVHLRNNTDNDDDSHNDDDDDDDDDHVYLYGYEAVDDLDVAAIERYRSCDYSSSTSFQAPALVREDHKNLTNYNLTNYNRRRSSASGQAFYSNSDFGKFVLHERVKTWLATFRATDPRHCILKYFNDVANHGANDTGAIANFDRTLKSPLLAMFDKASVFTVWRPTSKDAIRRMMLGEGVGKGLDIKGKSAKRGTLSAFVPFLQISEDDHKYKIRTLKKNSKIRIFFDNEYDRDHVLDELQKVTLELQSTVEEAKRIIRAADEQDGHDNGTEFDEATIETALENKGRYEMDGDTTIDVIDTYRESNSKYGLAVQERVFWEGMVVRQSITRVPGSDDDTGRGSIPSFQDMNFGAVRSPLSADISGGRTRAVLLQYRPPPSPPLKSESTTNLNSIRENENENKNDENDTVNNEFGSSSSSCCVRGDDYDPMCPLNLVMAYEEDDPNKHRQRVIPCVSDFDCFIVGSRGVQYEEEVPDEQLKTLKWSIDKTESILAEEDIEPWTKRWLDVLKDCTDSGGYTPKIPPGGYSDPKTKFIFKHAIDAVSTTGCVRHGAECFNYYFPQELDEEFLVISNELPSSSTTSDDDNDNDCDFEEGKGGKYDGRSWAYVDVNELKSILISKIKDGYAFPLNPKWILCDPGWKAVYDQLLASKNSNVKRALDSWYPPDSGIRERIESISKQYPNGFQQKLEIKDEQDLPERYFRRMVKENRNSDQSSPMDGTAAMNLARQELRELEQRDGSQVSDTDGTSMMDLAQQELKYHLILQRAKRRLKAILIIKKLYENVRQVRQDQEAAEEQNEVPTAAKIQ